MGYLVPAHGTPGALPDGQSCWDAAVAAAVIWKFRSTFRPGNYIWSLSLWIWTQMRHLGTLIPRFCTEFRYESNGQSGLAWGAIFEKVTKYKEIHTFPKWACPKNPEMSISGKKAAGGPAAETARSFSEDTLPENLPPQNSNSKYCLNSKYWLNPEYTSIK